MAKRDQTRPQQTTTPDWTFVPAGSFSNNQPHSRKINGYCQKLVAVPLPCRRNDDGPVVPVDAVGHVVSQIETVLTQQLAIGISVASAPGVVHLEPYLVVHDAIALDDKEVARPAGIISVGVIAFRECLLLGDVGIVQAHHAEVAQT